MRVGFVILIFVAGAIADDAKARYFPFAKDDVGKVPTGWTATQTGKGEGSIWKVVADKTSPSKNGYVLSQTAVGPGPLFNICVADTTSYKNVDIRVSFRADAGENDQGGGIVWRYQDAANYYIARYNPLEDNFRLYKVVAGRRIQLASKEEIVAKASEWHTLSITMNGEVIECQLNGKKHLEAKDVTFKNAGKIGLWTKADAKTSFDSLMAREIGK